MRSRLRRNSGQADHGGGSHDRWLLSYADFVTLLLAVFIVLFALSRGHRQSVQNISAGIRSGFEDLSIGLPQKGVETAPSLMNYQPPGVNPRDGSPFSTVELKTQLEGMLGDSISRHEIVVQQTAEGLTISLRDFGFFDSASAELLPGADTPLKKIAKVLIQRHLEVRVEGHSDNQAIHTPSFQSNWELSTARAISVLSLLLDEADFPPGKISVAGYGSYRPVADNATPDGRRMNRRVDLVVIAPKVK